MGTLRSITAALHAAATHGERVVLASVVRVVGSSYGGVGARMLVRVDGERVGLVSGGCLESDLAEHARRVHASGRAAIVTYDTRADDDAVWGLGLGCNGLIDVLLEPLGADQARASAALLDRAMEGPAAGVIATAVQVAMPAVAGAPMLGARALLAPDVEPTSADGRPWGDGQALRDAAAHREEALAAARRGLVRECAGVVVAFEVVLPLVRLVVCGSGPDAVPVARFAVQMGWEVTVVDHRPASRAMAERFPGAQVVECADPLQLARSAGLRENSAAVVMSHHFVRDTDYVHALLDAGVRYVGVLGPRSRTERILAELASRGCAPADAAERLHGPVGLDLGGEGPEAIALAIVAQVSAVSHGRSGRSLCDEHASGKALTESG